MRRFATILVVIAVLLVAGDFVLRRVAENAAAELIDEQIPQRVEPEVSLGGFPFLKSVLTGTFDEVTVTVPEAEENGVLVEDITLTFSDVKLEALEVLGGRGDLRAESVKGRGVISEESLTKLVRAQDPGLEVTIESNRVAISKDGTTIAATAVVAGNKLLLQAGELVAPVEIPLPELLPGIQFSSLRATPGELVLEVAGGRVRVRA